MPIVRRGNRKTLVSKSGKRYRLVRRRPHAMTRYRYKIPATIFPKKFFVALKYNSIITLNPAVGGVIATHNMCANGMYDPDITGVGHQPMGFDQWMALYNHYTVIGSKISATAVANETAPTEAIIGILRNDDSTVLPTSVQHACEMKNSRWRVLGPTGSSKDVVAVKQTFSAKRDLGISKPLSSANCRGNNGANPTEQTVYTLWAGPFGTTDLNAINLWVTITYYAVLTEPKDLAQS